MRTTLIVGVAMVIRGSGFAPQLAQAQQPGSKRTDLQRHDLSAPGREVVQVRVDFDPGYVSPRHTHPGEEIIYVLEGTLEYQIAGQPTATVKPGDVLFVPAGTIHAAKNVGSGKRGRARHVCRRKREAAHRAGQVIGQAARHVQR